MKNKLPKEKEGNLITSGPALKHQSSFHRINQCSISIIMPFQSSLSKFDVLITNQMSYVARRYLLQCPNIELKICCVRLCFN